MARRTYGAALGSGTRGASQPGSAASDAPAAAAAPVFRFVRAEGGVVPSASARLPTGVLPAGTGSVVIETDHCSCVGRCGGR